MKSIRLNKGSREDILHSMRTGFTENWFKKNGRGHPDKSSLIKAAEEARKVALKKLWDECYLVHKENLTKVPDQLLTGAFFSVAEEGSSRVEQLSDDKYPGSRKGADLVLHPDDWERVFKDYYDLSALVKRYEAEVDKFKKEVMQVLESVTTTGKLVEVWPAAEQYIPAYLNEPNQGINLPVLHTSRLDEALGVSNA